MDYLKLALIILLDQTYLPLVIANAIAVAGLWMVFRKCGVKGWKALIPCYRSYMLARCGNRESDGVMLMLIDLIGRFLSICTAFVPDNGHSAVMFSVLGLTLSIVRFIYLIRVYTGLCEVFGRKRTWALAWLVFEPVTSMLWGISGKFTAQWQVSAVDASVDTYFSGNKAAVMENGLTVNLESRTAREFMKTKYLLRDVHMNIAPGHMVLLLGGSGAGKTTLLNAINGYEKAKAEIHLNGSNVYTDYKRMQYEIGFVPQLDLMRGKDTVLHTLYDAAALRLPEEFSVADRHKRVDEVMGIFGLKPVKNNLVDKLSGGQRKRLSIAMEFISNPSLFILDEPDSGLDGVMARELMQQLRRIADQGKIVIVITHTPDRVIDLFDDVIVLAKDSNRTGRLAFYGPISEAKSFFDRDTMERIVMSINRKEEGGDGLADEFVKKFVEVQNGTAC